MWYVDVCFKMGLVLSIASKCLPAIQQDWKVNSQSQISPSKIKQSPHAQLLKPQAMSVSQRRLQKDKKNTGQLIYFCMRDGKEEIFGKIIKNYAILYKKFSNNLKNNYDIHKL